MSTAHVRWWTVGGVFAAFQFGVLHLSPVAVGVGAVLMPLFVQGYWSIWKQWRGGR